MKTREEVESLKCQWLADPSWDLETSKGFEEYADELRHFRYGKEQEWHERHGHDLHAYLGKAGLLKFAEYVMRLERRVAELEERFDNHVYRE